MGGAVTPAQKSMQHRAAALKMHSVHDSRRVTRKAREAFLSRFEVQVDPERKLSQTERLRRAELAKRAYFIEMALKSARARRAS